MDEIRIDNLEIYGGHGVHSEEQRTGQPFFVNAVLYTDTRQAGKTDELIYTTHYGEVSRLIDKLLRNNKYRLLEAAAEHTAEQILLRFPGVNSLDLEIRKPRAPIGLPLDSVSVKITRGWKKAYLGIGSNMGDKRKYMEEAVEKLKNQPLVRAVKVSEFLVTKPYGGVEQEDFLNGAIELETLMPPLCLLHFLQKLEQEAGRERLVHWGPRTLDLDLLFFQDFVSCSSELSVPHPDLQNREFVLKPLSELCPYYIHPLYGKSIAVLLAELSERL